MYYTFFNMSLILAGRLVLIALTIVLLSLATFAWLNRHYHIRGTIWFIAFSLSLAAYTAGFAFELNQTTVEGFFLASRLQYLGLVFVPPLWICLLLTITGRQRYLSRLTLTGIFGWSALILGLVWTNNLHHLYFQSISVLPDKGLANFIPGDLYPLGALGFFAAFFIGLLCLQGLRRKKTQYPHQFLVILLSSALALSGTTAYILGFRPGGLDLSPFTLAPTAVILAFGMFRKRLFSLAPIAREQVIESMVDAVVVLDNQRRIIDFNPAARVVFPLMTENNLGDYCDGQDGPCPQLAQALKSPNDNSGEFSLVGPGQTRWFQFHRSRIVDAKGRQLGTTIVLTDRTDYMNLLARMTELATQDPLTGICNRRRFSELAEAEIRRCLRYGHQFSLIMFDIDHFKHINDTWGHKTGDSVLKEIAGRAATAVRAMDILARIGGEEFMVMLPDTDTEGAIQTAERIRLALKEKPVEIPGNQNLVITASFGVSTLLANSRLACWDEEPAITILLDQMMTQADDAMYQAKNAGRDKVVNHGLC